MTDNLPPQLPPDKTETLYGKQEERLQKFNLIRGKLKKFSPASWVREGEIIILLFLFFINLYLLFPLVGRKDELNVFSAPLIPALSKLTSIFLSYEIGIRFWLIIFYLLLPFSVYFFLKELSARKLPGFVSAFTLSLPYGIFLSLRVNLGILSGDGSHLASLSLTPLVSLFLLRFLRTGNFWMAIVSSLLIAMIALISPFGLVVTFFFAAFIAFSEMILGEGRLKLVRFIFVILMAIGFSAFWYNPKFIYLTLNSDQGRQVMSTLGNLLPISFFLVPILAILGFLLFENRIHLQPAFLAIFWVIIFALLSFGGGLTFLSASRFLPSLGISLAFFLGIAVLWIFDFIRFSQWLNLRLKDFKKYQEEIAIGMVSLLIGSFIALVLVNQFYQKSFNDSQVLGWRVDNSIGIWDIREKTTLAESVFGYSITGLTIIAILMIKNKTAKLQ